MTYTFSMGTMCMRIEFYIIKIYNCSLITAPSTFAGLIFGLPKYQAFTLSFESLKDIDMSKGFDKSI